MRHGDFSKFAERVEHLNGDAPTSYTRTVLGPLISAALGGAMGHLGDVALGNTSGPAGHLLGRIGLSTGLGLGAYNAAEPYAARAAMHGATPMEVGDTKEKARLALLGTPLAAGVIGGTAGALSGVNPYATGAGAGILGILASPILADWLSRPAAHSGREEADALIKKYYIPSNMQGILV